MPDFSGSIFQTVKPSPTKKQNFKESENQLGMNQHGTFASFIEELKKKDKEDPSFLFQPSVDEETSLLPPIRKDREYTLVLDLDETLIHFEEESPGKGSFKKRPHASHFLSEVSRYYEVVIFTAGLQNYADLIIDDLDRKGIWITHRLYRHHTTFQNDTYLKDLTKLGRDLSKILIIDNCKENFSLQPTNGIYIKSWFNDSNDDALLKLCPILVEIVAKKYKDVRKALKKLKEKTNRMSVNEEDHTITLSMDWTKGSEVQEVEHIFQNVLKEIPAIRHRNGREEY